MDADTLRAKAKAVRAESARLREDAEQRHRRAADDPAAPRPGRLDAREAELQALHAEGLDLLADGDRLQREGAAGRVDRAAHEQLRARLRAHRGDLQRFQRGRAAG